MKKLPYMLIIGEKEVEAKAVSVRKHKQGDLGSMSVEKFKKIITEETNI